MKRDATLKALAEARHFDPFSVLGPHVEADGVLIRAIIPPAERVTVTRQGAAPVDMTRRHPAGIFEARLAALEEIPDYRLQVTFPPACTSKWTIPIVTAGSSRTSTCICSARESTPGFTTSSARTR